MKRTSNTGSTGLMTVTGDKSVERPVKSSAQRTAGLVFRHYAAVDELDLDRNDKRDHALGLDH